MAAVLATPWVPALAAAAGRQGFASRAMQLRDEAVRAGDQAYGAVVVLRGRIIGQAPSRVVASRDPAAHAEREALRDAAINLGTRDLSGSELYGSSPACRICEAAAHSAGIARMFHGPVPTDAGPPRSGD